MRAWRRRAVLEAVLEKTDADGARWIGGGKWSSYCGKRLIDEMICEKMSCDFEYAEAPQVERRTGERGPSGELGRLSDALACELAKVDWSRREVLVGSLGSREQFRDNLRRNYYYVPAKYLDASHLPIGYVALYQSANLFGRDAGVRYYGEVTETRRLPRREIKFRSRWKRDDEMYYAFRVKEWRQLPASIEVKDEGVYAPRLTNLFLLHHATKSYELFHVGSEEQYRLLYALKRICEEGAKFSEKEPAHLCPINERLTLSLRNGCFEILDPDGKAISDAPIRTSDFLRHPKYYFDVIVEKTEH